VSRGKLDRLGKKIVGLLPEKKNENKHVKRNIKKKTKRVEEKKINTSTV